MVLATWEYLEPNKFYLFELWYCLLLHVVDLFEYTKQLK